MPDKEVFDLTIIGAGPTGLFSAFYAGLRGSSVADEVLAGAARAFGEGGMPEVFRQWARVLERQAALGRKALDLAVLYALLGEGDRAFERLDAIIRQSHPALLWIPVAPVFDRLRADARYRTLLAQLRLAGPEV